MDEGEKACPFCAETIKAAAIVCKHCGRDLPAKSPVTEEAAALGIEWYESDQRFMWRGSFYKSLDGALAAARPAIGAPNGLGVSPGLPRPSRPEPARNFKWWLWVPLGAVAAFLAVGYTAGSSPEGKARSNERLAIELCWKDHDKKSLDPGTKRFVAGACERMESEFRSKWGVSP